MGSLAGLEHDEALQEHAPHEELLPSSFGACEQSGTAHAPVKRTEGSLDDLYAWRFDRPRHAFHGMHRHSEMLDASPRPPLS